MKYSLFVYNIILIILYTLNLAGYILMHKREPQKLYFWIAAMFGLYLLDDCFLYVTEYLPGTYTNLLFFKLLSYETGIAILLSYRMISGCVFKKNLRFWEFMLYACSSGLVAMSCYSEEYRIITDLSTGLIVVSLLLQSGVWFYRDTTDGKRHDPKLKFVILFTTICYCLFYIEMAIFPFPITQRQLSIEVLSMGYVIFGFYFLKRVLSPMMLPSGENGIQEEELLRSISVQYGLTARETEILALIIKNCSNSEICSRLYIALGTVKVHTHNIYEKLGIQRREQIKQIIEKTQV